jgi:hypothetical protein
LSDAGDCFLSQDRSQGLRQADGSRRLSFTEWRGVDARDDYIIAVLDVLSVFSGRQRDLGFGNPPRDDFVVGETDSVESSSGK